MSGLTCRDIRLSLGIYVVGAIDPAERRVVEMHLSHCSACREELAGLAGLPALLGRVPAADARRLALASAELKDPEELPARLLSSLLDAVAARRRTRRWRVVTAAAAAAVIAVGGGLAGGMAVSHVLSQHAAHGQQAEPELVKGTNPRAHITAEVSYAPAAAGTTMQVWVSGIKVGTTCQFWVVSSSGQRSLAGIWTVAQHQATWYPSSSPIAAVSVHGFEVTSGTQLLVYVPAN